MKLTRKHDTPCLSFELELGSSLVGQPASFAACNGTTAPTLSSSSQSSRHCTHDVPVSLIPRRLWADFAEPEMQVRTRPPNQYWYH